MTEMIERAECLELIARVLKEHPGPWQESEGYTDRGGRFTSIRDANYNDVFDGEFGHHSDAVYRLLLNFPAIAAALKGQFNDNTHDASTRMEDAAGSK